MSLTKEEWVEMWQCVKTIESINVSRISSKKDVIKDEVNKMKKLIQSVIGQME